MAGSARLAVAVTFAAVACVGLVAIGLLSPVRAGTGGSGSGNPHDQAVTDRIVKLGTTENRAMEHLDYMCNRIGARPAGTESDRQACEWACDRLRQFGLANVHLEECGEIASGFFESGRSRTVKRLLRRATLQDPDGGPVKLYNVVADIPGTRWPDEYVIVGAHIDSPPRGAGATDNATGVAAVMEAARLLMEAGARPARTIRFILFAGEEVGLVGSGGYVKAHPELVPKISAMYNMDHGSEYISEISATEPLLADMKAVFTPAAEMNPGMPFAVQAVDYLPMADPNCCKDAVPSQACGDGSTWMMKKVLKRNPDGSIEEADLDLKALGITEEDIKRGYDSQGRKIVVSTSCGGDAAGGGDQACVPVPSCSQPCGASDKDQAKMGTDPADTTRQVMMKTVAMGSSDHAPFLSAGIPSFWWGQSDGCGSIYPAHSDSDTFDKVVPRHIEHSATVIALGALGTANLDHMLSRERLTNPAERTNDMGFSMPAGANP